MNQSWFITSSGREAFWMQCIVGRFRLSFLTAAMFSCLSDQLNSGACIRSDHVDRMTVSLTEHCVIPTLLSNTLE